MTSWVNPIRSGNKGVRLPEDLSGKIGLPHGHLVMFVLVD
jgi:hypothetical protein